LFQYQNLSPKRQPSVIRTLILANIAAYILHYFFIGPAMGNIKFLKTFAFVPKQALGEGHIWQFVTYMFLHGENLFHIFINMFLLYMFGSRLEQTMGKGRFLALYFICGIGAALLHSAMTHLPVVGASGAVFGVLAGYAYFFPNSKIFVLGIIPVKAWKLITIYGVFELMRALEAKGSLIAHSAHFGGLVIALIFLEILYRKYLFSSGNKSARNTPSSKSPESSQPGGKIINLEKDQDGLWK